jgi:2-phospho-L-lactate guanylyltransferase
VPTVGIIPVKSFRFGNQRLGSTLGEQQRIALGQALAGHVGETVEQADLIPLVVTGDGEVLEWATAAGFPTVPDPATGLDTAAAVGVEWASATSSPWMVIHSDLPLLRVTDLRALTEVGPVAIAPSSDGGTSAIAADRPIPFSFGRSSFHKHLARLPDATVVATAGLLHDVDTAADLRSVLSHRRGAWLEDVLQWS